jgi:DNA polymerase
MPILHLDYETFCGQPGNLLLDRGAYRYAADPTSEILLMALALDNEDPLLFVPEMFRNAGEYDEGQAAQIEDMLRELLPREDTLVYAHNAQFEIAITRYLWETVFPGIVPPRLSQWRCTAALARRAALHASLEGIGADLKLSQQKSKTGMELIKRFSGLQPATKTREAYRIYPWDDPQGFRAFGDYCVQDVVTEREVHKALKAFEFKLPGCVAHFEMDKIINDRGIQVNVDALRKAKVLVEGVKRIFTKEFRTLTGVNPTQRAKFQSWIQARGYPFKNMQADSVEDALERNEWCECSADLRALELYSSLSYAAVSKIDAMLNCECGDGIVRGTLLYHGANTGRWSGKLIQPQNFKRATVKATNVAYDMVKEERSAADFELLFGNPIEVVSSSIRHFMEPHDGNGFFQADYAAVEARIICWLAGQEDALEDYRRGVCRYKLMATKIYHCKLEEVDSYQRWVAKQAVLGCGFQLWWPGFQAQCRKYGKELDDELCENAVVTWRNAHQKVVSLWKLCDTAAKQAIASPGSWFKAGPRLAFAKTRVKSTGWDFLFMRLPSGRMIAYPDPQVTMVKKKFDDGKKKMVEQITFYGPLPKTSIWGRASTYGGKLAENATQATAADAMAAGTSVAESRGFEIATLIHDEALAYYNPNLTLEQFCEALCTLPDWADGLPLVAEGKLIPYYLKA